MAHLEFCTTDSPTLDPNIQALSVNEVFKLEEIPLRASGIGILPALDLEISFSANALESESGLGFLILNKASSLAMTEL